MLPVLRHGAGDCHAPVGLAMTVVVVTLSRFAGGAVVDLQCTAERHGGRSLHEIPEFPKPRIPYAERIPATGRAVLLDCRQAQSPSHEFSPVRRA